MEEGNYEIVEGDGIEPPVRGHRIGVGMGVSVVVVAVGLALALAGPAPASAGAIAQDAALIIEEAWSDMGEVQGFTTETSVRMPDNMSFQVVITVEMYEDGAVTVVTQFDADTGDEKIAELEEAIAKLGVTVYCSPMLLVMKTEGLEDAGLDEIDAETTNSAGTCYEDAEEALFWEDVKRLYGDQYKFFEESVEDFMKSEPPQYTLVEASWQGNDVVAVYNVTSGNDTWESRATIRDGRIVEENMAYDLEEPGFTATAKATYRYGLRAPDPTMHGLVQV